MTYNKKSISPVISFIIWAILLATVCLVGISNVFALTNPNPTSVQLYDNLGSYLTAINTDVSPGNGTYTWYGSVGLTANSYGAAVGFQSNDLLVSGHMYSLTIYASADNGSSALSTKNNIGLGTSLSNAVSSYLNGSNVEISYTSTSNDYYYYIIKVNTTAGYLVVPFNRTVSCSNCTVSFSGYELKDLGDSSGLTQNEVNNIINNQTTIIQNNITQVEENIKKSNEEMENTLKNEIKNTEENIKDGIKEGFESCRDSINLFNPDTVVVGFIDDRSGKLNNNGGSISTDYIEIKPSTDYFITTIPSGKWGAWYDENKTYISGITGYKNVISPSNAKYMRLTVSYSQNNLDYANKFMVSEGSTSKTFEKYGQICTNRIDDTNKKLDEANETSKGIFGKIKDLFNWFTNDDDVDTSGLNNTVGWLPPGPVDSILNLPLTMLSGLNTALSKSCTPLDLTIPFVNKPFQMPCISTLYQQIDGFNTLWNWIGTIVSVLMLYTYLLKLYKWVDDTLTFRENNHMDNWGGL